MQLPPSHSECEGNVWKKRQSPCRTKLSSKTTRPGGIDQSQVFFRSFAHLYASTSSSLMYGIDAKIQADMIMTRIFVFIPAIWLSRSESIPPNPASIKILILKGIFEEKLRFQESSSFLILVLEHHDHWFLFTHPSPSWFPSSLLLSFPRALNAAPP